MADSFTPNFSLVLQLTGSNSGTWGDDLNNNCITIVDQALGRTTTVALSSSNVNLTTSQCQTLAFNLTGTLSGNVNVTLPFAASSTTIAVGGRFVVNNNTTGAFNVTVNTTASGSVGVIVPQGVRSAVYSDGTNVSFADDVQGQTPVSNGNPNGSVAGSAGSINTRASKVIDYTTNTEFLCTTSGTAGSAQWTVNLPFAFPSQGYITPNADATNVIQTSDSLGATTLYYSPYKGNLLWLYNGISFTPIAFSQLTLTLSSSAQAANGIYDVIGFLNGTAAAVAFSPAWSTPTAGSGARGTGPGTPQLARVNGILVNANQYNANNGAANFTIGTSRGTYLGSVWIDSTAGQVTSNVSYGLNRKWGPWNAYNRLPIRMLSGDTTTSWAYGTAAFRPANNNTNNKITMFTGLPEEWFSLNLASAADSTVGTTPIHNGIGWNSTSVASGVIGAVVPTADGSRFQGMYATLEQPPTIGINVATMLEKGPGVGGTTWVGTQTNLQMVGGYNG